jgi:hypothetical protein
VLAAYPKTCREEQRYNVCVFFFSSLPRWFKRELTDRLTHHFAKVAAIEPLLTQVSDRSRFPKKRFHAQLLLFQQKAANRSSLAVVSWKG